MTKNRRITFVEGSHNPVDSMLDRRLAHTAGELDHKNKDVMLSRSQPPTAPARDCDHPRVAWDAPIAGGNVNGFASEAISLIVPLSRDMDIRLHASFYDDGFVSSLEDEVRDVVQHLHMKSMNWSLPSPDLWVSQWSPPEEVRMFARYSLLRVER